MRGMQLSDLTETRQKLLFNSLHSLLELKHSVLLWMLGMICGVQAPFPKPDSFSLPQARSILLGCCFFKFQETNKTPKFCPTCPNPLIFPFHQICLSTISSQLQPFNSRFLDMLPSLVVFTPMQLLGSDYFQAGLSSLSLLHELSIFVLIQQASDLNTARLPLLHQTQPLGPQSCKAEGVPFSHGLWLCPCR